MSDYLRHRVAIFRQLMQLHENAIREGREFLSDSDQELADALLSTLHRNYNSVEAAKFLDVSESWLCEQRAQGRGPLCLVVGGIVRYSGAILERYARGDPTAALDGKVVPRTKRGRPPIKRANRFHANA
jgi:hypothetical protein